jgi:hypothetical protein
MRTDFLLADFRLPVKAPKGWKGHVIFYKEYRGIGLSTLNLCDRFGEKQTFPPYSIGQKISVNVGGQRMRGEVYRVDIHRPGWDPAKSAFDAKTAQWIITVAFPRIPKGHLRGPLHET